MIIFNFGFSQTNLTISSAGIMAISLLGGSLAIHTQPSFWCTAMVYSTYTEEIVGFCEE